MEPAQYTLDRNSAIYDPMGIDYIYLRGESVASNVQVSAEDRLEKGILSRPALYISYFLKMNRVEYYDRMTQVRKTGDYEQWVIFFLQALSDSASDAIQTIDKLTVLHNKNSVLFDDISKRQKANVLKVFSYIETNPIIGIQKTAAAVELSYNTVSKIV